MGAMDSPQSVDVIHVISLRKRKRDKERERIIIISVKIRKDKNVIEKYSYM